MNELGERLTKAREELDVVLKEVHAYIHDAVDQGIPVSHIARDLGMSRQGVYHVWKNIQPPSRSRDGAESSR